MNLIVLKQIGFPYIFMRGVEDGIFGTANWMNNEDIEDSFEVGTEDGIIVGKLNDKIVTLPNNTLKIHHNMLNPSFVVYVLFYRQHTLSVVTYFLLIL